MYGLNDFCPEVHSRNGATDTTLVGITSEARTALQGSKKHSHQERSDESRDEDEEGEVFTPVKASKRVSHKDPFKKYGCIFCHLGGVFTSVIEFVQAGVDWEIGHQGSLSRSNMDLSTASQPKIDSKEVKELEPLEWVGSQ